jgi:hypothetical protein
MTRIRFHFAPLVALGLLATLAPNARACSQCMCGDPFPTTAFGAPVAATFRFGVETRLLSKNNGLDDIAGTESEREQRVAPFLLWTASPRFIVAVRQTYAFKRIADRPDGAAEDVSSSRGFGDGEVLARYRAIDLGMGERGGRGYVALLAGVGAPTGRNHLTDATGTRLDEHLQTGIGAWSGTGGVDLAWPAPAVLFETNASVRVNGTNAVGYRYGTAVLFDAGATTRHTGLWQFVVRVDGRVAQEDHIARDGTLDPNSGGAILYASPGVRWFGATGLVFDVGVQAPIAQQLDGTQREHATARVAISLAR